LARSADRGLCWFLPSSNSDSPSVARTFANVLQVSEQDASFYLESCGGNIELALNMFLNQQQSHGVSERSFCSRAAAPATAVPWARLTC